MTKELCEGIEGVHIKSIVPLMSDPHMYQPSPGDAVALKESHLIVTNGLGFEEWIDKMITVSGTKGQIVVATKDIITRTDTKDPHAWHNPLNGIIYINNIADALKKMMPSHEGKIEENRKRFASQLQRVFNRWSMQFSSFMCHPRIVITTHDAFWYFGDVFGIKFESPIGISTEEEAKAADVAQLIEKIKKKNIKAVFIENLGQHQKVVHQIAQETGRKVHGTLYGDSLSPQDGPAASYIEMINHNAKEIFRALQGQCSPSKEDREGAHGK